MDKITSQVPSLKSQVQSSENGVENEHKTEDKILTENGFYWRETDGVKVLVCRPLEETGFANGFSTRVGGVSNLGSVPPAVAGGVVGEDLNLAGFDEDSAENIYENRRRFLGAFNHEYLLATAWQVHGNAVKIVRNKADIANSEERADSLISDLSDVLVGVKTADCVPILLGDPKTGAFAAVHAGWRGTVQSIATKTVEKMREIYRTDPSNLIAAIGPAACAKNYEIGQDVIDAFRKKFSESERYLEKTRDGHALIDLHLANRDQLVDSGVPEGNIYTAPFCTMERTDLFFSYRKEKKTFGKTGRLLSIIGRRAEREKG